MSLSSAINYGPDFKPSIELLKDYSRQTVCRDYDSLDDFQYRWSKAEYKTTILQELKESGLLLELLADEVGKDFSTFDLICHVAFDQPLLTRRERANNVKKSNFFAKYSDQERKVLERLLEEYVDTGIESIEDIKILTLNLFKDLGTASELVNAWWQARLHRCAA